MSQRCGQGRAFTSILLAAGGGITFWFTTFQAIANAGSNALSSPIWQVAGSREYKALV